MREILLALVLVSVFSACGEDEKSQEAQPSPQSAPVVAAPSETAPKAQGPQTSSFLVQDPKELPACDETRRGALGYAFSSKGFYACDGLAWARIEIQGEKGEKGDRGEKGDPAASVAAEEPTEEPLGEAEWEDPVTGRIWLVEAHGNLATARTACGSKYTLPSSDALRGAAVHGIYAKARAIYGDNGPSMYGWSSDDAPTGYGQLVNMVGGQIGTSEAHGEADVKGIFCLKK